MARTEKQQAFLDALFGDAEGDFKLAMKIAGYSDNVSINTVVNSLKDDLVDGAELVLARYAPMAAFGMASVMEKPGQLGAKEKMAAAEKILDRVGISKRDRLDLNVQAPNGLFVLPPKDVTDDGDDED